MPSLFGRFSLGAEVVLTEAQKLADSMSRPVLSDLVLLSIMSHYKGPGTELLSSMGVTAEKILIEINGENNQEVIATASQFQEIRTLLEESFKVAAKFRFPVIDVEHLIYAMLGDDKYVAFHIIKNLNINPKDLYIRLNEWLTSVAILSQNNEQNVNPDAMAGMGMKPGGAEKVELERYVYDITAAAEAGQRDPVVGREKEIAQMEEILLRRQKNNPLLLGEAGVGKTALVDGLAQKIVKGDVPQALAHKHIFLLDLGQVVAGTMYRGQFEERLKAIVNEIQKQGNIILFIDEIHTLTGAGSAEGSFDAANILKPALARGEISIIGATTNEEYRKSILKDRALDRRFQIIKVEEPSQVEAEKMLKGIKKELERFHHVTIGPEVIRAAVELSSRYIHDRYLPDKAIDILDQACTLHAEKVDPKDLTHILEDRLNQLEQEKIEIVQKASPTDTEQWEDAKKINDQEEDLVSQLVNIEEEKRKKPKQKVTIEDVQVIIAQRTGIAMDNIQQSLEPINIRKISDTLSKFVLGQDDAIKIISRVLMRNQLGLSPSKKPIGSFLLVGPTGVGKTETGRVLAQEIFGDSKALIKIDMSEYMERHNLSNLIGAPAGYIGYDKGGSLTEQVRQRPYSVILFDEVEKAHPDIFNILLQILEDGVLTDNTGNSISFEHTLVIMTSNIGMESFNQSARIGFSEEMSDEQKDQRKQDELYDHIKGEIDDFFRPELLGRLNAIVFYKPLNLDVIRALIKRDWKNLVNKLKKKGFTVSLNQEATSKLVSLYEPEAGARSINRLFIENVEPVIIEYIIKNPEQKKLELTFKDDKFTVQNVA